MLTLVIGGASSGKSRFAEDLVLCLPGHRVYLATMEREGTENRKRIAFHRDMRKDKGFDTVECSVQISSASLPAFSNVLLEDLPNLVANEMFSPQGRGTDTLLSDLRDLSSRCAHLTVVTGELFSDGADYDGDTLLYLQNLAELNNALARQADLVVEVVASLPNILKGRLPQNPATEP